MSFSPSLFSWGPLLSMILILTAMSFTHGNMYEKGTTDRWGAKLAKKVVAQMCFLSEALSETTSLPLEAGVRMDMKVLQVGQELMKEMLPLQSGSRLYELQGLNSNKWYEVKISYPASIPANFTLQLSKGSSGLNVGRKLLNTEKIIFQAESLQLLGDEGRTFVLVSVEPEGIVAIPGVKERKHIIYNIVCDELLFGIPHQAWYVVVLVVLCLALALVIPSFLLPRNEGLNAATHGISKDS